MSVEYKLVLSDDHNIVSLVRFTSNAALGHTIISDMGSNTSMQKHIVDLLNEAVDEEHDNR